MTVYAITDTKKGRTGIAPTYLQTTPFFFCFLFDLELRQIFKVIMTLHEFLFIG